MKLVTTKYAAPKFKQNLAGVADRFEAALTAAMNMARSMILEAGKADIASAGNFGGRWTEGLHVTLNNMRLSMTHDVSYADIFETGGVIQGKPLLWIGLSGTDAAGIRPSEYGGLFSARPTVAGQTPLMFSITDKQPKYFGIESVTIPKIFHLNEIVQSVMANFRQIFDSQFRGGGR